jgi:type I restriction enzyme, S subunit
VGWGEIGTRLDCTYFRATRRFDRLRFVGTEKLGRLLKAFFSGGTPLTTNVDFWEGDLPWASPKDFGGSFFISDSIDHIAPSALKRSSAKLAEADTVLMVVRSGVLAHSLPVAVTTRSMAINQDLKAMVPHDRLRADYLAAFLSTFSNDILPIVTKHGVTVQSVNSPELLALPVPVPNLAVQKTIATMLMTAHEQRDARLAEAAALLASIDDYLLDELGIVLPPEADNSLANRTFRVKAHELGGWRFDPYHHRTYFQLFEDALECGQHPLWPLKSVYRSLVNGYDCRDFIDDGLPYLKVAEVKPFNLKIEAAETIPKKGVPARGLALKGDLLLTRKGTFGDAALNRAEKPFAFSSEVFRIRLNPSKLDGDYAEAILNSILLRTQFNRHSIGAIMGSLSQSIFGKVRIPLPPLEEQRRLAQHCLQIREQANSLEVQAAAELDNAKREIEAILLGGGA